MARRQRRGGRLDDGGVAEQRVAVAGGERRRNEAAGARAQHVGSLQRLVAAVFGRELARGVDLWPRDVGVDVDSAGHDDHPASVDPPRVRADVLDHLAVVQAHVAQLAVDVVGGVVDGATDDPDRCHRSTSSSSRPSSAAAVGAPSRYGAWSASGTPSSRWAVPTADTPAAAVRIDTATPGLGLRSGPARSRSRRRAAAPAAWAGSQPKATRRHPRSRPAGASRSPAPDDRRQDRPPRRTRSARPARRRRFSCRERAATRA